MKRWKTLKKKLDSYKDMNHLFKTSVERALLHWAVDNVGKLGSGNFHLSGSICQWRHRLELKKGKPHDLKDVKQNSRQNSMLIFSLKIVISLGAFGSNCCEYLNVRLCEGAFDNHTLPRKWGGGCCEKVSPTHQKCQSVFKCCI